MLPPRRLAALIILILFSTSAWSQIQWNQLLELPTRGGIEGGIPQLQSRPQPQSDVYYYVASFAPIKPNQPTHVIVAGAGANLGLLFQNAAAAQAQKLSEVFPSHQVVLFVVNEMNGSQNEAKLRQWGFSQVQAVRSGELTAKILLQQLMRFSSIASFDLYSHSSENSASLDWDSLRWNDRSLADLRGHFTDTAWATLHGCNTGWKLAPALSADWGIAVAGSLTGTHFEGLHSSGEFYAYDEWLSPPGPFAIHNDVSFDQRRDCSDASCLRMKPDNAPYSGRMGKKSKGLPFYKFFCKGLSVDDCSRRMALSLTGFIDTYDLHANSPKEGFVHVLYDFMCPIHRSKAWRRQCLAGISHALKTDDLTYSPFLGPAVDCDLRGCAPASETTRSRPLTFMREIEIYLQGIEALSFK